MKQKNKWNLLTQAMLVTFFSTFVLSSLPIHASMTKKKNITEQKEVDKVVQHYLEKRQYGKALNYLNNRLLREPNNTFLLYEKGTILIDLEEYQQGMVIAKKIRQLEPNDRKAIQFEDKIKTLLDTLPQHSIGLSQDEYYVSDLRSYWSYTSLYYYRKFDVGTLGLRVNHANRYGTAGEQYVLEAYPHLFKDARAELLFGFSNASQRVFPHYQYSVEPYYRIAPNFEASLGMRGIKSFNVNIYTYTGSLAFTVEDYIFSFRPYHYTPKSQNYFEFALTRFFSDADNYVLLKAGTGKFPDIGDVPPFNQIIIIRANALDVAGQYALSKTLFLKGHAGYNREVLPSGTVRRISSCGAEINWHF